MCRIQKKPNGWQKNQWRTGVCVWQSQAPRTLSMSSHQPPARARCISVTPFSSSERDRYLESRLGEQWIAVPSDVRDTLRRPLLAHIYCNEVAASDGWQPQNEYTLYDRMWQRLGVGIY